MLQCPPSPKGQSQSAAVIAAAERVAVGHKTLPPILTSASRVSGSNTARIVDIAGAIVALSAQKWRLAAQLRKRLHSGYAMTHVASSHALLRDHISGCVGHKRLFRAARPHRLAIDTDRAS